MSSTRVGENRFSRADDNDYWKGTMSAITTQGEVTVNCRVSHAEISQRRNNMRHASLTSYGGGDDLDNLHVLPNLLTFGWVKQQGRNQIPGHPNQIGFQTLNGVNYGITSTDEELEMRIRFICLAKTPFIFDNPSQLKHGFTGIYVGTGSTWNTGIEDIYPGDKVYWSVIPRPKRGADGRPLPLEGGRFGDDGQGSRQGNPFMGIPRGRYHFRVNPSRFNDARPSLNAAITAMFRSSAAGGIADRPYEHLFNPYSLGNGFAKPTALEEMAMAFQYTQVVTAIRTIRVLQLARAKNTLGGLSLDTATEMQLVKAIGLFETDPSKRGVLHDCINGLYMFSSANRARSANFLNQLKRDIPSAFNATTGRPQRFDSDESRYVQVVTNLGNLQMVAWSRAHHVEARKRFATALNFSRPGNTLDLCIGHFTESL